MGRRCIVLIDGLDSRNDNDRFNKEFVRIYCLLRTEMINWVNSLRGMIIKCSTGWVGEF